MDKIDIQNISKRFDDKLVLDNISMQIKKGEIFGLIGPNGAGKSTLINIIIGLIKEDNGHVLIDGKTIQEDARCYKKKIGLVPQELALIETLNAIDNLEYFGTYFGLSGKRQKESIKEILELTGLGDSAKKKVKTYSGGMKRRLNVAVAMLSHPEILIMDEPTVGVDPQSRNHIFDFIKKINLEEQTTIIYTSHYMEEVEHLCNRIFILDEGKKISYGTKGDIRSLMGEMQNIHLFVDCLNQQLIEDLSILDDIQDVNKVSDVELSLVTKKNYNLDELILNCQKHQLKIRSVYIEEPSLEEIFLSLTGRSLRD